MMLWQCSTAKQGGRLQSRTQAAIASTRGASRLRWWRSVCGSTTLVPRCSAIFCSGMRASCLTSSAPTTSRHFPSVWRCNYGGAHFRAMCLWRVVHLAQAGVMNEYTRALYMQGACIFMQGGGWLWNGCCICNGQG